MQRVSSFLPSWEKRKSHAKASSKSGSSWWSNRSSTRTGSLGRIDIESLPRTSISSNRQTRAQRESFWPMTLDIECNRAGRILKTFCNDGFLAPLDPEPCEATTPSSTASDATEPQTPAKVSKKIPQRVIENAAGIAVFSCMRNGLWLTGSGGSGILIARKSDESWSPPSGIMLHTPTLSFIMGVDIYDCVLVINTPVALESITRPRVTLGEDVKLAPGPLVTLDDSEDDFKWDDLGDTVLAYVKARGQHRNVDLTGSILTERCNENEKFYAAGVTQSDVLAGKVDYRSEDTFALYEVVKMAEGRIDIDHRAIGRLAQEAAPGDATLTAPNSTPASPLHNFGIPDVSDPDPFGVLALEMAGLEIREAGTKLRPTSSQLGVGSDPSSPTASRLGSLSVEARRSISNLGSSASSQTAHSQAPDTPDTPPSQAPHEAVLPRTSIEQIAEVKEVEAEAEAEETLEEDEHEESYASIDVAALESISPRSSSGVEDDTVVNVLSSAQLGSQSLKALSDFDGASKASSHYERSENGLDDESEAGDDEEVEHFKKESAERKVEQSKKESGDEEISPLQNGDSDGDELSEIDEDDLEDDDEEPVVFEVASVQPARTQVVAPQVVKAKGSMVTISKRLPPPLPTRSPARMSHSSKTEIGDVSHLRSLSVQSVQTVSPHSLQLDDAASSSGNPPEDRTSSRASRTSAASMDGSTSDDNIKAASEYTSDKERKQGGDQERTASLDVERPSHSRASSSEHQPRYRLEVSEPAAEASILRDSRSEEILSTSENEEQSDDSDTGSPEHQTSSICTDAGLTEDHWSVDESALTTPTSDRHFITSGDAAGQDTPTKTMSAISDDGILAFKSPSEERDAEKSIIAEAT